MTDIQIVNNDSQVRFEKKLWHPTELTLAKCYGFHIDIDTGVITANINETYKKAMFEFIRVSFKNFSEAISEENRRNKFYEKLDALYTNFENSCLAIMREKLPYFDKLYDHQKEGIIFCMMHRVNFLAFEMRLGKSGTSASLSRIYNIKRTVIISPSIGKWGWFRDLTSSLWGFNELYFTMMDAAKSKSFKALQERFFICNYDVVAKFEDIIVSDDIGHFIIDESHRLANRHSQRSKIIQKITSMYPNARITFLSGTPITSRFDSLFNYFKIAGHALGESFKKFTDEYTIKTASRGGEKITGAKNIDDLKRKMLNFMLVKRMDDCFDMPEDVVSRYTFDFDDYRDDYNAVIDEMAKEKNMSALRGHINSINIITTKAKMKGIIQIIEDIVEENGKCVVFGSYKEPFKMLEEHFGARALKVDGTTNSYDRDRYKREFWDNPEKQVFLGQYLAAGEALDLSCASDVVHINFPFTPRELRQAQFRCKHPEKKGQHLRIHYTFAKDSIDEHIYNILFSKERDINKLLDGKEVLEMEKIEEILIKQLLNRGELPTDDTISPIGEHVLLEEQEKVEKGNDVENNVQDAGQHQQRISFEEMQKLITGVEDNKSQFINSAPELLKIELMITGTGDDAVAKSWEHVEKNRVPRGGIANQISEGKIIPTVTNDGLKDTVNDIPNPSKLFESILPPPPSFL